MSSDLGAVIRSLKDDLDRAASQLETFKAAFGVIEDELISADTRGAQVDIPHLIALVKEVRHVARDEDWPARGETHIPDAAGYVSASGHLYLFRSAPAMREFMQDNHKKWSQAGWIDGVTIDPEHAGADKREGDQ